MTSPSETAVRHNYAVIICGDDAYLRRAVAAGFDIVGSWPSQGATGIVGQPPPSTKIALRKSVPTHLAGFVDYYTGERAPEEWFV